MQSARGYILHRRPYKETSLLADIYTLEHGLVRAVVNGVRKSKRQSAAEPFSCYELLLSGRSELKTARLMTSLKTVSLPMGASLYSGLYVNELMLRAEKHAASNIELFAAYEWVLTQLETIENLALALRQFELLLLKAHGMEIAFTKDTSGKDIEPNRFYRFVTGSGFQMCLENSEPNPISGNILTAIAAGESTANCSNTMKYICRLALMPLVGSEPFESRKLFTK